MVGFLDESPIVVDAHDARHNGAVDSNFTAIFDKLVKDFSIKEHLGNDKIW